MERNHSTALTFRFEHQREDVWSVIDSFVGISGIEHLDLSRNEIHVLGSVRIRLEGKARPQEIHFRQGNRKRIIFSLVANEQFNCRELYVENQRKSERLT